MAKRCYIDVPHEYVTDVPDAQWQQLDRLLFIHITMMHPLRKQTVT